MNTLFQKMRNNRWKAAARKFKRERCELFDGPAWRRLQEQPGRVEKAVDWAIAAAKDRAEQMPPETTHQRWYRASAWFNKGDKR